MKTSMQLVALSVIATAAFAQHGGGFRGGVGFGRGPAATASRAGQASFGTDRGAFGNSWANARGFGQGALLPFVGPIPPLGGSLRPPRQFFARRGWGNDFFPYFPSYADYAVGYPPAYNVYVLPPAGASAEQPPPKPVHPVIHEYPENAKAETSAGDQMAFTLALKDGSRRSAETVWVQDDILHYVDSQGQQEVLALNAIDRDTTQRLNQQNNLHLQLPL